MWTQFRVIIFKLWLDLGIRGLKIALRMNPIRQSLVQMKYCDFIWPVEKGIIIWLYGWVQTSHSEYLSQVGNSRIETEKVFICIAGDISCIFRPSLGCYVLQMLAEISVSMFFCSLLKDFARFWSKNEEKWGKKFHNGGLFPNPGRHLFGFSVKLWSGAKRFLFYQLRTSWPIPEQ